MQRIRTGQSCCAGNRFVGATRQPGGLEALDPSGRLSCRAAGAMASWCDLTWPGRRQAQATTGVGGSFDQELPAAASGRYRTVCTVGSSSRACRRRCNLSTLTVSLYVAAASQNGDQRGTLATSGRSDALTALSGEAALCQKGSAAIRNGSAKTRASNLPYSVQHSSCPADAGVRGCRMCNSQYHAGGSSKVAIASSNKDRQVR